VPASTILEVWWREMVSKVTLLPWEWAGLLLAGLMGIPALPSTESESF
jgi:hypothetical protein